MRLELALDILLIVLLVPTVVYVVLLQRRLASLRADRDSVDAVVEKMNEATRRAEASLKGIRQTAEQAKAVLDDPMARAQALRDELSFLVQRADAAGERLAGGLSSAGAGTGPAPATPSEPQRPRRTSRPAGAERPPQASDRPVEPDHDDVRSQAERDLMNALRNVR